jgi:ribosomal-protein-alanine N-acetyltransferase
MLHTPRLLIAPLTKADCKDIHYKNCFPEVAAFNTIGIPKSIEVTEKFLQPLFEPQQVEQGQQLGWSIRLKENNTFMGELGMRLTTPKYNKGEIHYSLIPTFWNKGYATEAVVATQNLNSNKKIKI